MAETLERESIQQATNLCPFRTHMPRKELYARYDEEADVLYLQFQRPPTFTSAKFEMMELSSNTIMLTTL